MRESTVEGELAGRQDARPDAARTVAACATINQRSSQNERKDDPGSGLARASLRERHAEAGGHISGSGVVAGETGE